MTESTNLLEMTPVRTCGSNHDDHGRVRVLIPRYGRSPFGRWLAQRIGRPHIGVKLDEIGSAVWEACDGSTPVASISQHLARRFGDAFDPGHERLADYLRELEKRHLIRWQEHAAAGLSPAAGEPEASRRAP